MGYCYEGRKLCCDNCGFAGSRKYKCPYGYCQAVALCKTCKADPVVKMKVKKSHSNCEEGAKVWNRREQERRGLLMAGYFVRCSAFGPYGTTRVWFEGLNCAGQRDLRALYMSHDVYTSTGKALDNLTVEDYMKRSLELGFEMREDMDPKEGVDFTRTTVLNAPIVLAGKELRQ